MNNKGHYVYKRGARVNRWLWVHNNIIVDQVHVRKNNPCLEALDSKMISRNGGSINVIYLLIIFSLL